MAFERGKETQLAKKILLKSVLKFLDHRFWTLAVVAWLLRTEVGLETGSNRL
jgi:hypothetical protein